MWFFKFQRYGKIEAFCLVNQKSPVSEKCSTVSTVTTPAALSQLS